MYLDPIVTSNVTKWSNRKNYANRFIEKNVPIHNQKFMIIDTNQFTNLSRIVGNLHTIMHILRIRYKSPF